MEQEKEGRPTRLRTDESHRVSHLGYRTECVVCSTSFFVRKATVSTHSPKKAASDFRAVSSLPNRHAVELGAYIRAVVPASTLSAGKHQGGASGRHG